MPCLHILHSGLTYGLIGLLPITLDWPLATPLHRGLPTRREARQMRYGPLFAWALSQAERSLNMLAGLSNAHARRGWCHFRHMDR